MKVLILLGKFSSGGTERFVSRLTQCLPESVEPTIVITEPRVDYPYRGTLRRIHLPIFTGRFQYHIHLARALKRFIETWKIVREVKPDSILAFMPEWGVLGALFSRSLIFSVRIAVSPDLGKHFLARAQLRFIFRNARALVCVSKGVQRDVETAFNIRTTVVIPNFVDEGSIAHEARQEPPDPIFKAWLKQNVPIFITVGRAAVQKGQGHLIRAFAETRRQIPCKLVLMGDGVDLDPYIHELVNELAVGDDVLRLGFKDNPFPYLVRSDAFVLPSLFEGFPNVCIEAMACGLPVLAADCPSGLREILAPDTPLEQTASGIERAAYGILVPVCDGKRRAATDPLSHEERVLAAALLELARDQDLRAAYADKARVRVKDFSKPALVERWVRVFSEVSHAQFSRT